MTEILLLSTLLLGWLACIGFHAAFNWLLDKLAELSVATFFVLSIGANICRLL